MRDGVRERCVLICRLYGAKSRSVLPKRNYPNSSEIRCVLIRLFIWFCFPLRTRISRVRQAISVCEDSFRRYKLGKRFAMNAATFTLETVHGVKQSFSLGVIGTTAPANGQATQNESVRQESATTDQETKDCKRMKY